MNVFVCCQIAYMYVCTTVYVYVHTCLPHQALHAKLEKEATSMEEMELRLTQRSEEVVQLSSQLQEAKDREAELNASFEQLSEVLVWCW